jgi:hypothetical protein
VGGGKPGLPLVLEKEGTNHTTNVHGRTSAKRASRLVARVCRSRCPRVSSLGRRESSKRHGNSLKSGTMGLPLGKSRCL